MTDLFSLNVNIKNLFPISLKLFETSELNHLQERIVFRQVRGKEVPYVRCIIRNKEIQLKPEEVVRQLFTERLINHYNYSTKHIQFEYPVSFGREKKFADIVVFEKNHPDAPYIIIETKKPKLKDGKDQLKSYCHATGAPIAVWSNGEKFFCYHRKSPNYFEDIPEIPKATQSLADIVGQPWTLEDLRKNDKLLKAHTSLKDLILDMEDEVLANAGVDVFEELFKLIFTKLYDEMESARNTRRFLEFRNDGDSDGNIYDKIQNLFTKAKQKWPGVFDNSSKLTLTASHLSICVSSLQDVKLFNSNLEVIDEAFEYLINQSAKGAKGQYFTPRYVIDLCVKMLNPKEGESMIDTAAGSCGFPMHCTFHVWDAILKSQGLSRSHLFTAENKPVACSDYVTEKVFAIDFDEKAVRVARTMNLIAGDGQTNVLHLNTLDWSRWNNRIDNDWRDTYWEGWRRLRKMRRPNHNDNRQFDFDILMANPPFAGDIKETAILSHYELAKNAKGKRQSKVGRDILFIERNLDFLKPGGRMAIVLPQGRFNNSSDAHIRKWLAEHGRILAVVGLHGNVFKPHTGTKTSVLFLQKWTDDNGINPRRDDYPIFFATMQKPSKDNSGEKIYLKDENGYLKHDGHGHLMVDHDLFNHEGLTQDGIFEAFAEFAKKEKLSFFLTDGKPFNPQRYQALLERLEVSEVLFSNIEAKSLRIDYEFYSKYLFEITRKIRKYNIRPFTEIVTITDGNHMSISDSYCDEGIPYYRGQDAHFDFLEDSSPIRIDEKTYNQRGIVRSHLKDGDIVLCIVGAMIGLASIYYGTSKATCSCKLAILRPNKKTNADVLFFFLKSRYGQSQIQQLVRGTTHKTLLLEDMENLMFPEFSDSFSEAITSCIKTIRKVNNQSLLLFNNSQSLLLSELGLNYNAIQQFSNSAIQQFSNSAIQQFSNSAIQQ